jgi:hypothetical protein
MANVCFNVLKDVSKDILSEEDAKALFDKLRENANAKAKAQDVNASEAIDSAASEIINAEERALAIQKRNAYKNILVRNRIISFVNQFKDKAEGYRADLVGTQKSKNSGRLSVDAVAKGWSSTFFKKLVNELNKKDLLPLFNSKEHEFEIGIELFSEGESKNPQVREIGKIIKNVYEESRKLLNNAGADIGTLQNFVANQTHSSERMLRTGDTLGLHLKNRAEAAKQFGTDWKAQQDHLYKLAFERWKNFILPRLDNEMTFKGADPDKYLESVFRGLVTGNHLKPLGEGETKDLFAFRGQSGIAKRVSQERKLHFKDGQSWVEYNKKYGANTVQESVLFTLQRAGTNLGVMRRLGPNPEAMHQSIKDYLREQDAHVETHDLKLDTKLRRLDGIFDVVTGKANQPVSKLGAKISSSLRAITSLSKLGGVVLSSFPDIAVSASKIESEGNGFFSSYKTAISNFFEGMPKGEMKKIANSLGVMAQADFGHIVDKFSAYDSLPGSLTKTMQTFFKFNLSHWWDSAHRTGYGIYLSRRIAMERDNAFDALSEADRQTFNRYGIDAKEWDLIRSNRAAMSRANKKYFITPDDVNLYTNESIAEYLGKNVKDLKEYEINSIKTELEEKLQTYFIDQADDVIMQPGAETRYTITGGTNPGTFHGELRRFVGQFKAFPIEFWRRVVGKYLYGNGADSFMEAIQGKGDILGLTRFMLGATVLGYGAMSAKDIAKGRTPRDPLSPGTWSAALLQGGGLGIYGDFIFGEYNRFGNSFLASTAGPVLGEVSQLAGILAKIRDGEDPTNQAWNFVKNNTPLINLFYTRMALDYLLLYGIQEDLHPGSLRRMEHNLEKQNNQQFMLPPSQYAIKY